MLKNLQILFTSVYLLLPLHPHCYMNSFNSLLSTESKVSGLVYVEEQRMDRNSNFMERSFTGNIFVLLEYEGPVVVVVFNLNMEMNF